MIIDHDQAQLALKAALLLLAIGDLKGAEDLARLLVSADVRDGILLSLIREHYNQPTWDWD